jgi:hypothetical protein
MIGPRLTLADLYALRAMYGGDFDSTGLRLVGATVCGTRVDFGPVIA